MKVIYRFSFISSCFNITIVSIQLKAFFHSLCLILECTKGLSFTWTWKRNCTAIPPVTK